MCVVKLRIVMGSTRAVPHARCYHIFFLVAILSFLSSYLPPSLGQPLRVDGEGDRWDLPRLYIVYLLPPKHRMLSSPEELETWHKSFLPTPSLDSGEPRMVHSYSKAISGFAALLTPREVENMRQMEGLVDAMPDEPLEWETTHTPEFLGLVNGTGLWQHTRWGAGRVIGVIDSNIDPDHISFSGVGLRPPPQWKGTCDFQCTFPTKCTCTNKLLGARTFNFTRGKYTTHGTMVASIAAGDFVSGAGYGVYAKGTASGSAPQAYLSFYVGNTDADILAAIERAIADGVDVLSISLSDASPAYYGNTLAIGTLAAVEHGVFVAMAAGNYGPAARSVRNDAPWLLTVGACTSDRALEVTLVLDVKPHPKPFRFYGVAQSLPGGVVPTTLGPIRHPGAKGGTCNGTLGTTVKGAIVLCWRDPTVSPFVQADTVKRSGGAAMVLMNDAATGDTFHLVPYLSVFTVAMRHQDSKDILRSVNSQSSVRARFAASNSRYGIHPYPVVADFSARGPGQVPNGILKPDILGPGVNILCAKANTQDKFTVSSGTSFATPHLAAVAAMLKFRRPGWSPAAIRSAIMTTAETTDSQGRRITDHTGQEASFYAMGAGLVDPQRAADPGLVYDVTDTTDYVRVLCSLYKQKEVNKFAKVGRNVDCSMVGKMEPEQLNYPSITMKLNSAGIKKIHRKVTNVGPDKSHYKCTVEGVPREVRVSVSPCRLSFTRMDEKKDFTVAAELVGSLPSGKVIHAYLKWTSVHSYNFMHLVTSPLFIIAP